MAYEPKTWANGETVTPLALNNIEGGVAEANGDYVPHEWECGEVVTADLLNHIEQGIANAGGDDPTVGTFTIVGDKMADPTTGSDALHSFETIKIPSNVKTMASGAFVQSYLKSVIWESAEVVPSGAFSQCNQLEYVYLGDGVTSIDSYAFHRSTTPFVLDCGFAEGAVSGAPWGATNATINYNVPAPREL